MRRHSCFIFDLGPSFLAIDQKAEKAHSACSIQVNVHKIPIPRNRGGKYSHVYYAHVVHEFVLSSGLEPKLKLAVDPLWPSID